MLILRTLKQEQYSSYLIPIQYPHTQRIIQFQNAAKIMHFIVREDELNANKH